MGENRTEHTEIRLGCNELSENLQFFQLQQDMHDRHDKSQGFATAGYLFGKWKVVEKISHV